MNRADAIAEIKSRSERHYVYGLHKPGRDAPFYVGVGTALRIFDHAINARHVDLDSHKLRTIRKLWRDGLDIDYRFLGWFEKRADAESAEASFIARYGRRDLRTGFLTNVTAGGEGASAPSDEVRSKRSVAMLAIWAKRDKVKAMSHLHNRETWDASALARTGQRRGSYNWKRIPGPKGVARKAQSERMMHDPVARRPGVGAKISKALKGRVISDHHMKRPELRARFSGAGNPFARPIQIEDIRYSTRGEAAIALSVNVNTIDYWLRFGRRGAKRI